MSAINKGSILVCTTVLWLLCISYVNKFWFELSIFFGDRLFTYDGSRHGMNARADDG